MLDLAFALEDTYVLHSQARCDQQELMLDPDLDVKYSSLRKSMEWSQNYHQQRGTCMLTVSHLLHSLHISPRAKLDKGFG